MRASSSRDQGIELTIQEINISRTQRISCRRLLCAEAKWSITVVELPLGSMRDTRAVRPP